MPFGRGAENTLDELTAHLQSHEVTFTMNLHGYINPERAFVDALNRKPELCAFVGGMHSQKETFGSRCTYNVVYLSMDGISLGDVTVAQGALDVPTLEQLLQSLPERVCVITKDFKALELSIKVLLSASPDSLRDIKSLEWEYSVFPKVSWTRVMLIPELDQQAVKQKREAALLEVEVGKVVSMLRLRYVQPVIRTFLTMSYLAQDVAYDPEGADDALGVLCGKKATPVGFATACEAILKSARVPCFTINGENKAIPGIAYAWNIVELDDDLYHMDTAVAWQDDALYTGAYLLSDALMAQEYLWSGTSYSAAGYAHSATDVLSMIKNSAITLKSIGIPVKYLLPQIYV